MFEQSSYSNTTLFPDLHGGAGSSSPGSSRPVSEVFSLSSEYYSRATSSDHIYHDVSDYVSHRISCLFLY